jgi:hypothetical protein
MMLVLVVVQVMQVVEVVEATILILVLFFATLHINGDDVLSVMMVLVFVMMLFF